MLRRAKHNLPESGKHTFTAIIVVAVSFLFFSFTPFADQLYAAPLGVSNVFISSSTTTTSLCITWSGAASTQVRLDFSRIESGVNNAHCFTGLAVESSHVYQALDPSTDTWTTPITGYTRANPPGSCSLSSITWFWGANGNPATTVYYASNSAGNSGWVGSTNWSQTNMVPGQSYTTTVQARDRNGWTTSSVSCTRTAPSPDFAALDIQWRKVGSSTWNSSVSIGDNIEFQLTQENNGPGVPNTTVNNRIRINGLAASRTCSTVSGQPVGDVAACTTSSWSTSSPGNVTLEYTVDSTSSYSESNESDNVRTETMFVGGPPPDPPANFTGSQTTSIHSLNWTWSASSGADYYEIFDAVSGFQYVGGRTSLTWLEQGLSANTSYGRQIRACSNITGCGAKSAVSTGTTRSVGQPTMKTPTDYTGSSGQVNWNMTYPDDVTEVQFEFYVEGHAIGGSLFESYSSGWVTGGAAAAGGVIPCVSGDCNWKDVRTRQCGNYWIGRVRARDISNTSIVSSWSGFTSPYGDGGIEERYPGTPTGVSATAVSGGVTIDWSDTSYETEYEIRRSTSNTFSSAPVVASGLSLGSTSWHDSNITCGTRYYYWVNAIRKNSGGTGLTCEQNSSSVSITPSCLSAPTNFTATRSLWLGLDWSWKFPVTDGTSFEVSVDEYNTLTNPLSFVRSYTKNATGNALPYATGDCNGATPTASCGISDDFTGECLRRVGKVRAWPNSAAGWSGWSNTDAANMSCPMDAPTNLNFTNITQTSLRVNWNDNTPREWGYKVYRSTSSTKPSNPIATLAANSTSYNDSGLTENTRYYYWVDAYNYTDIASINGSTTTLAPTEPDFTVSSYGTWPTSVCVGDQQVFPFTLNNQGSLAGGYFYSRIYANGASQQEEFYSSSIAAGGNSGAGGSSCSASTDRALCWTPSSAGSYSIDIQADTRDTTLSCNGSSSGSVSESDEGNNCESFGGSAHTVQAYAKLTPPQSMGHAGNTSNSITWNWGPPATGVVSYYVVEKSNDGVNFISAGQTSATSFKQTTDVNGAALSANTKYYARVRAVGVISCANSSLSTTASAYTSMYIPTVQFGTITANSINVRVSNPPTFVDQTAIMFEETNTLDLSGWKTDNTYWTHSSLQCATQYGYTVIARNGDGDTVSASSPTTIYTSNCGPSTPGVPTNLSHSGNTQTSINWTWGPPSSGTADSYEITVAGSPSPWATGITSTSYNMTGLTANSQVPVQVRACNSQAATPCSAWTSTAYAYTSIQACTSVVTPPSTVSTIQLGRQCSSQLNSLSSGSSGIVWTNDDTGASSGKKTSNTEWVNTGLQPGCEYPFSAETYNGDNELGGRTAFNRSTLPNAPGACTGSVVSNSQINWSWGSNGNCTGSTGAEYEVTNAAGTQTWGTGLNWNQTGLSSCTTYVLTVKSRNQDGIEAGSTSTCVQTTTGCDNTPPTVTINGEDNTWRNSNKSLTLSCTDVGSGCDPSKDGYILYSSDPGSCPTLLSSYTAYSGAVTIDKETWVCAYAEDYVGLKDTDGPVQFKVDKTSPVCSSPQARPDSYTDSGEIDDDTTIYFTWNMSDSGGSGISNCSAEIGDNTPDEDAGTDNQDTDTGVSGLNTYYVQCWDNAGNGCTVVSDTITIDNSDPVVSNAQARPDSYTDTGEWDNDTTIYFTWNSSDSGSGIAECYAEIGDTTPDEAAGVDEQDTDTGIEGASNVYYVQCVDNSGRSSTVISDSIGIDLTAPVVSSGCSLVPSGWTSGSVTASVTFSDSLSGINGNATQNCTRTSNGSCSVSVNDNAGNQTNQSCSITNIDTTAPTITSVSTSSSQCNQVTFTVNNASDGSGSGLNASAYSFDGGATWQSGNTDTRPGTSVTILANQIKVRDTVGNQYVHTSAVTGTSPGCNQSPNKPTGLVQQFNGANKSEGAWVDYPYPSFIFNISDPDAGDVVGYRIEIDNNSDFSSPERLYDWPGDTSQGQKIYNVTGTPLADGSYYWRVRSEDDSNAYSSWADLDPQGFATAALDFRLDSTDPIVNANGFTVENTAMGGSVTITSSGEKPTVRWSTSDASSGINHIELWRADYNSTNCRVGNTSGCNWSADSPVWSDSTAINSSGRDDTSVSNTGAYVYGMHVIDNAGNCILENGAPCIGGSGNPVQVTMNIPDPDFTISLSPSSQSVTQPASANYAISITNVVGGFSGSVSFSGVNGCPTGATCSVPGTACAAANYANCGNLTISNTALASTGTYNGISVNGISGSISKPSGGVSLTITAGNTAPNKPTGLSQQFNGSTKTEGNWVNDSTPRMVFSISDPDVGDVVGYRIEIDQDAGFASPDDSYDWPGDTSQGQKNYDVPTALVDGDYYWRVRSEDDSNAYSSWADLDPQGFATAALDFKLDTVNPVPGACSFVPSGWTTGSVTASVTFTDARSGISGSATKTCTRSSSGDCSVSASDNAGNSASQTCSITNIDADAPTITSVTTSSVQCNSVRFTVNGASDGSGSGLNASAYSFDGGATWQSLNYASRSGTSVTIAANQIRVRDALGNEYSHPTAVSGTASSCNQTPNVPTGLIQQFNGTNKSEGAWANYAYPTFIFNISDPDAGDVVGYVLELDNNSDFSSPVRQYEWTGDTSQGQKTYNVTGTALTETDYYWRVRTRDDEVSYSGWADDSNGFGSTGADFRLDLSNPILSSFTVEGASAGGSVTITSSGQQPTVVWSASDARSGIKEVKLYRTNYNATDCNGTTMTGCSWNSPWTDTAASGSRDDTSVANIGDYWYGIHVDDNAGNCILESGQSCSGGSGNPVRVIMNIAAPDFTINLTPNSQSITQGAVVAYSLEVVPTGGFGSTVGSWIVNNCPSGGTCSVNPSSCGSSSFSPVCATLTISNTASIAAGTHNNISVNGTGGSISKNSNTVSLDVTQSNNPPYIVAGSLQQVFNGTSKSEGAWVNFANPSFRFQIGDDAGDVVGYRIEIDNTSGFGVPDRAYTWPGDTSQGIKIYNETVALPDGDYYWRVRAQDDEPSQSGWYDTDPDGFGGTGVDFRLDTVPPIVNSFTIEGNTGSGQVNPGGALTITNSGDAPTARWNTSDARSGIGSVKLYRANYENDGGATDCDESDLNGCSWSQVWSDTTAINTGTGRDDTTVPSSGTFWYRVQVSDNAGNCVLENNTPCTATGNPIRVTMNIPNPDYSLSNNGPVSVEQGGAAQNITITVTSQNGFSNLVSLSQSCGSGLSCSFPSGNTCTPVSGGSCSITFRVGPGTAAVGSYTEPITGSSSGYNNRTTNVGIDVTSGTNVDPTAGFTYCRPDPVGSPELIEFTDTSTDPDGTIDSWNWNFGDGSSDSSLQNPSHNYSTGITGFDTTLQRVAGVIMSMQSPLQTRLYEHVGYAFVSLFTNFIGTAQAQDLTEFSDQFTESITTELSSHTPNTLGSGWTQIAVVGSATLSARSGTLQDNGICSSSEGALYQTDDVMSVADYEVRVTQTYGDTSDDYNFLAARIQDANNLYLIKWNQENAVTQPGIYKNTTGSLNRVASIDGVSIANGSVITLKVLGNVISMLDDGVEIASYTDPSPISNPGHAGIGMGALTYPTDDCSSQQLDNFEVLVALVPPSAPTNITFPSYDPVSVSINWTDTANNEDGYKIYQDSVEIADLPADSTSYTVSGLNCNTDYTWTVEAYNAGGVGSDSAVRATEICPPSAPTNITFPAHDEETITINWTDNASNEAGYRILQEGVEIADLPADTTSYIASGLSCSTSYSWTVEAYNAGGSANAISSYGTTICTDWWNQNWLRRRLLTFDNSGQSETLTDFPVLVVLDSSRIDYSQTQNNGEDLRFLDANGTTILDHEIESWNESGTSYVWVKIPVVDGSSNADAIWMYYGNDLASDGQNATGVWSNGFAGVWHMSEEQSGTAHADLYQDSTSNNNDGDDYTSYTNQSGRVDGGQQFGTNSWVDIPDTAGSALDVTGEITLEALVYPTTVTSYSRFVAKQHVTDSTPYDMYGLMFDSGQHARFAVGHSTASYSFLNGTNVIPTNQWTYVAGTRSGATLRTYLNGALDAENPAGSTSPIMTNDVAVRIAQSKNVSTQQFVGQLDEIRISNVARSADWIAASNLTMSDSFISPYGGEEVFSLWWNNNWTRRRKIFFDNSGQSENLDNFPLLVTLDSSSISYSDVQNNGQDLRFIDADGIVVLDYEIETWNPSGTSRVWVKVPRIDGGSIADSIWMYYGNPTALDGQNASAVWNNQYKTVYHFNDNLTDSTSNANNGTLQSTWDIAASGNIASDLHIDEELDSASGARYTSVGVNDNSDWTILFWYKGNNSTVSEGWMDHSVVYTLHWSGLAIGDFQDPPSRAIKYTDYNNSAGRNRNTTTFGDGVYDLYTLTQDRDGGGAGTGRFIVYKNGSQVGTFTAPNGPTNQAIKIGHPSFQASVDFNMDEFRVSGIVRSADWIRAQYLSMTGGLISSIDVEEIGGGTISPPTAPSDLAFPAYTETTVDLSWTDNASDETQYRIYKDGIQIATLPVDSTSYQATGLSCGTPYAWIVEASNAGGTSNVSGAQSTVACPIGGPYSVTLTAYDNFGAFDTYNEVVDPSSAPSCSLNQTPGVPVVTGPLSGNRGVNYTYTANATDPDGDQIIYEFDWDNDGVVDATDGPVNSGQDGSAAASFTTLGAQCVRARANDQQDVSPWSTCLNATMINVAPNQPSNPDPADGEYAVPITTDFSFDAGDPDGNYDTVTYYLALYENGLEVTGSPFAVSVPGGTTRVTINNSVFGLLTGGSTYTWQIDADDGVDNILGPIWTFTAIDPCAPLAPSSPPVWSCDVNNNVDITWDWNPGVTDAVSYKLQIDDTSDFSSPVYDQDVGNVNSKVTLGHSSPDTYYGRVKATFGSSSVFTDTFTTGSNTELSSHTPDNPVGSGWTQLYGGSNSTLRVASGDYLDTGAWWVSSSCYTNEGSFYQANTMMTSTDYDVSVLYDNQDSGDNYSVLGARVQDINNMYAFQWSSTRGQLFKRTSGFWTQLGSDTAGISEGSTITLRVVGVNPTTISVLVNGGDPIISAQDSDHDAPGYVGIGMGAVINSGADCGSQRLDDFDVFVPLSSCGIESSWSGTTQLSVSCGLNAQAEYCRPDPSGDPNTVAFFNSTVGGVEPYTQLWNFDDGTSNSSEQHPEHTFESGSVVARYEFEEGAGTVLVDSINGNNGTLHNMEDSDWKVGPQGGALDFDGVFEYVSIPHSTDLEVADGKIDFWFKMNSNSPNQVLFSKDASGQASGGHIVIGYDMTIGPISPPYPGTIAIRFQDPVDDYWIYSDNSTNVSDGLWHNLEVYFGSDGLRMAIDGEMQSDSDPVTQGLNTNTAEILVAASNFFAPTTPVQYYAQATIDDLRIVDTSSANTGPFDVQLTVTDSFDVNDSEIIPITPASVPSCDFNLTNVSASSCALISVAWDKAPGADEYELFRSDNTGSFRLIDVVDAQDNLACGAFGCSYDDTSVSFLTNYDYYVRALRFDGSTKFNDTVTPNPACYGGIDYCLGDSTPSCTASGVAAASPSCSQIKVDWVAPAGGVAEGYNLYRSLEEYGPFEPIASSFPGVQQTLVFNPTDDARVRQDSGGNDNYGNDTELRLDDNFTATDWHSYLKFDISGLGGDTIQSATLRLYAFNGSSSGGDVYSVSSSWNENSIVWNSAPAMNGSPLDSVGSISSGSWVEYDVTSAVTDEGTFAFGLQNNSSDNARFWSKEYTGDPDLIPQLEVITSGIPPYCPAGCDILASPTQTTYTDTEVLSDVNYWYNVTTVVGGVESSATPAVSGATYCFRTPGFIEQ